jgi:signal transduction histidine kinase
MTDTARTLTMPTAQPQTGTGARAPLGRMRAGARRIGLDLAYIVAILATSILAFCVWVTGLTVTASLLILVVGIFCWLATAYAFRWTTRIDRGLAGWARGRPIAAVYRRPREPGVLARIRSVTADPQTWKDLGWLMLNSILGFAAAVAAITFTGLVLGYITMPLWWHAVSNPHDQYVSMNLGLYTVHSTGTAFLTTGIGIVLAPFALLFNRGVVAGHAGLAARILGPSESQALRARVDELARSRSGAVEVAQEQLDRIERDLHDGAQARIVALAMELGMADEELERNPDAARETVRRARDEALAALGELRDLSRGIRPALLEERGLAEAVGALAERPPLPITIRLVGDVDDVPDAVQTAAYFVVAEGLTNAAKHSGAARARVSLEHADGALEIAIEDDGAGGADAGGRGIDGLRKRVEALDGRLEIASPTGGPTAIRAVIPCA